MNSENGTSWGYRFESPVIASMTQTITYPSSPHSYVLWDGSTTNLPKSF